MSDPKDIAPPEKPGTPASSSRFPLPGNPVAFRTPSSTEVSTGVADGADVANLERTGRGKTENDDFKSTDTPVADETEPKSVAEPKTDALPSYSGAISSCTRPAMTRDFLDCPIMGGIIEYAPGCFVAWTGGTPNFTWTGLEGTVVAKHLKCVHQHRPNSSGAAQKALAFRTKGLDPEHRRDDDFLFFTAKLYKVFVQIGCNAIVFLPDPRTGEVVNVLLEYVRFDLETARLIQAPLVENWDDYDRDNDAAAVEKLLASLELGLRTEVEQRITGDDTFVLVLLQ